MPKISYETIAAKINAQAHIFAHQGFIISSYRYHRGRKLGPYFRLAYRDENNRQRSIYIGPHEDIARRIQSLLDDLKAPHIRRRQFLQVFAIIRTALNRHRKQSETELNKHGLYSRGFAIRGLRKLKRSSKLDLFP
jgi:hypothetical protein